MNIKLRFVFFSRLFIGILLAFISDYSAYGQLLKSVIYDFDGLNISQSELPDGDYSVNDLTYKVAENPLPPDEILGDRVLQLNLSWSTNYGAFGRGISRYIEFDPINDIFNFYFYNPLSNNQNATFDIVITDDDDQSNTFHHFADDTWKKSIVIPGSSGWQLFSVPLKDFTDENSGGNGIFDIAFTQNKGMILMVEFCFTKNTPDSTNPIFYIDMINFSDGTLPTGANIFEFPNKNSADYCDLGAYKYETNGEEYLIPKGVENLFPNDPKKKLKYVNYYIHFSEDGSTVASELPGNEVQILLDSGYTPIITWEPIFEGYDRLDSRQPRLDNIINGDYNSYIDAFADQIKIYTDTVMIRFMHEFEGDWYSWSLSHNNFDPTKYITAYRKVVDRFRAKNTTNIKWIWCINSDYAPYLAYNWVVPAYPGDSYVDVIATDIYNSHYPTDLPWWKSFKTQAAESYYYLTKYFPQKPLYICELGCRERFNIENNSSQSKGLWLARMDKELQSNFHNVRGLIFFDAAPDHNWLINSSSSSLQSLTVNIWNDPYYFGKSTAAPSLTASIISPINNSSYNTGSVITIQATALGGTGNIQKVEFFADSIKLGEDTTSPYSFEWNNVIQGNYKLIVKGTDSLNNTITSSIVNVALNIAEVICSDTGTISRDVWNNINGTLVSSIPINTSPDLTGQISIFQAPENIADNYGQRIRGYVCAPFTGNISSEINISVNTSDIACIATGKILREVWNISSGTPLNSIPFNTTPNSTSLPIIFEAPQNIGDNYGSRMRGYVCPPLTGNYTFWIASDNNSELWLSTNDQVINKIKIASVTGYTSSKLWTKYPSQQSTPVNLVAGTRGSGGIR